ncbi:MAG: YwbE family protein [Thermodesulfobacteriota bacterium]
MDGKNRRDLSPGMTVEVVQKADQRTGRLTRGIVKDILTRSAVHPHGIKVRLADGTVGRVKRIVLQEPE